MRSLVFAVVTLLSGCVGPGPGADPGSSASSELGINQQALSGTRLKVRFLKGDDGSEVFLGMFDTQRNENCAFAHATDGQRRCLPLNDNGVPTPLYGYFSDAACTLPLFGAPNGCTGPTTGRYSPMTAVTCPVLVTVYGLTAGLPAQVFKQTSSGGLCETTQLNAGAGFTYYTVSGTIPPGSFVAATEQTAP